MAELDACLRGHDRQIPRLLNQFERKNTRCEKMFSARYLAMYVQTWYTYAQENLLID